jgi:tryptophan-rich sensory protein
MKNYKQYSVYKKPRWAPPAWVFGPVWSALYIIILISFGYVAYLHATGAISLAIALPFLLNLVFNLAYAPIQFRLNNFLLAAMDVLLVLSTLVWALVAIFPLVSWVAYINLPYLAWVSFALVLQITVTIMNRKQ